MKNSYIITDCEVGIRNYIKNHILTHGARLFRCWNHLFSSIERWPQAHNFNAVEISFYLASIRELLLLSTKKEFDEELEAKIKGK